MRLVFLSTYGEPCGIATYTEALEAALRAEGVETAVLAPHRIDPGTDGQKAPPRLWSQRTATLIQAFRTVRAIAELKPDVVHVQHNFSLYTARFLAAVHAGCRILGIPLTATLHGRPTGSRGGQRQWRRLRRALSRVPVVVHTEAHRRDLAPQDSVTVIAHGVQRAKATDPAPAKQALGLDTDVPVFAHFGFLHPHKGVREVIEAVAEMHRDGRRVHYLVCGACFHHPASRRYFVELRETIAAHGLEQAVSLDGRFLNQDELMAQLRAADWIVLNYLDGAAQGASGAARHALSAGRPIAVSPDGIFDDLRDAVHTLEGPLASSLTRLLNDERLEYETLRRGVDYCAQHSWEAVARHHLTHYERLSGR